MEILTLTRLDLQVFSLMWDCIFQHTTGVDPNRVQDCSISIAYTLGSLQFCTGSSKCNVSVRLSGTKLAGICPFLPHRSQSITTAVSRFHGSPEAGRGTAMNAYMSLGLHLPQWHSFTIIPLDDKHNEHINAMLLMLLYKPKFIDCSIFSCFQIKS